MPEERVLPFFRRERLTERKIDLAIPFADFFLNTPFSRSIASLRDCTRATHLRFLLRLTMDQYMNGSFAVNCEQFHLDEIKMSSKLPDRIGATFGHSVIPRGFHHNSPTFQRWVGEFIIGLSPEGTAEWSALRAEKSNGHLNSIQKREFRSQFTHAMPHFPNRFNIFHIEQHF
jgi:hypothetical protein